MPESKFTPAQEELAEAFARERVEYLFIGKSGAKSTISLPAKMDTAVAASKAGPFALDLIHASDGIEDFAAAKSRSVLEGGRFPVASLKDIIASKRAAGREKDLHDVKRLEQFRTEYMRRK